MDSVFGAFLTMGRRFSDATNLQIAKVRSGSIVSHKLKTEEQNQYA
jgi:hypothetical protein